MSGRIAASVLVACALLAFGIWQLISFTDRQDARYAREEKQRDAERLDRANSACGADRTADFRTHGNSWAHPSLWYEVVCEREDGGRYLVVIE